MNWFKIAQRWYDPDAPGEVEEIPEEQEMPVVTPENIGEYIDPEEDEQEYEQTQFPPETYPEEDVQTTFLDEMPEIYDDDQSIIEEAIEDQQCIAFEYTSIRTGHASGWRLLEPYAVWTATTGNILIIGWDRHRDNIRCFGIDGISPGTLRVLPGDFYSFIPNKFIFNPQY